MVTIWVVTPHESMEFDEWWGPCETDEDHDAAYDYAHDRLEEVWDQYDAARSCRMSVTMEQREVDEEDFQRTQDD